MAEEVVELPMDVVDANALVEHIVTEDDEPVDNLYSEKQQRLLTEPLYSSWSPPAGQADTAVPRPFLAAANVGLFAAVSRPPLVPWETGWRPNSPPQTIKVSSKSPLWARSVIKAAIGLSISGA